MSIHSRCNDIIQMVVAKLRELSDPATFAMISNGRDIAETTMNIKRLVYDVMSKSDFCYAHGDYFLFTGEIYEHVDRDLLGKSIEEWLMSIGVNGRILHYSMKKIQDEAMLSIRINKPFIPTFHIKAYMNGVVDFTTCELHPFDARFHVIYKNPYKYDPSAKCPIWHNFLKTILPEKESRLILQMYLGLCMYDRGKMADKVERCLMLYGSGSNGKGVIFETISGVFGKDNISTLGLLSLIKGGDERMRNVAKIDGKVINICPEIQAKDISGCEDAFKTLCSGEPQHARRIGGNVYVVYNVPRLIFSMNNIPKASDNSYGYFRRFLYVVFEYIIPEDMQNKHLAEDLKSEYSGILNWIIRGSKYLKKRNFVFPISENNEKQKLLAMGDNNVTFSWAFARGVRPNQAASAKGELYEWIQASDMYEDMVKYADLNGFKIVSNTEFGRQLGNLGFGKYNKRRNAKGIMYKVYGCSAKEFQHEPPIVNDMEINVDDTNNNVEYDAEDL